MRPILILGDMTKMLLHKSVTKRHEDAFHAGYKIFKTFEFIEFLDLMPEKTPAKAWPKTESTCPVLDHANY